MTPETSAILLVENSPLQTGPNPFRGGGVLGRLLRLLPQSKRARTSMRNSLYGAAEYVALPLGMLLATPLLLRHLGLAQFGIWMLASAAITSSNLISTGFGDAALKYASMYRTDSKRFENTLRVNLTINLALGATLALLLWCGAPYAAGSIFKITAGLRGDAIAAFRIGSLILLLRCIEGVLIGALRSHERYGPAVQISIASRSAIVLAACFLVWRGHGIVAIMAATLCAVAISVVVQMIVVRVQIARIKLIPSFDRTAFKEVFSFGGFSWLQAVAGCVFNQADRLLVGALLGASSVGYYSVCVQAAQPIHGLLAAGLHFLFPHLSARLSTAPTAQLRGVVASVFRVNVIAAIILCLAVVIFSKLILRLWMGPAFAAQAWMVLSIIALSFGFLSLNVTAHYALLALAHVRLVALLNLLGGAAMLVAMLLLAPRFGLAGAAAGRLLYGPITLLLYGRLHKALSPTSAENSSAFGQLAVSGTESR
jgi:O-antigen/teichoic acid export membrane protein